jgi:hypothetical protein
MKITNKLRLEFENIYPEEKEKNIIKYLSLVTKEALLSIIGFTNTYPQPNFDNFITNESINKNIIKRVSKYCFNKNINEKPGVVSREGSLKLAEIILSNKENLIDQNNNPKNDDLDEINLFKSFLLINKEINNKQKLFTPEVTNNTEKIAQMIISMSFSTSDLGVLENNDYEFKKLVFCAIERFEILVKFLNSNDEYKYLEKDLYKHFNLNSIYDLRKHVKYLFFMLLELKTKNSFKFVVEDDESKLFLNSLISNKIEIEDDFTSLKQYPIYKLDDKTYSIIDNFFIVDKFYKSVRFILKNSFNRKNNLPDKDRTFFSFFNTKFSEEFLMKDVLDRLFNKKYFVKKKDNKNKSNEPDYYLRHNKRIYLFESKDVLIKREIKSSGDIEKILNVLKEKFLITNKGVSIGIGQLVNSIYQIVENNFEFDDFANQKNKFIIYPILLVNDRILEIPGINYILNQWYLKSIKDKVKDKFDINYIKPLTIIDIDTIIFGLDYFSKNDKIFREFIDIHLKEMNTIKKPYGKTIEGFEYSINRNLMKLLSPISLRYPQNEYPLYYIEKFKELITN